jgi:CheY-like chemotaxis protein
VLVSDIGMPHEDGYSLIRRLRTVVPSPPPALAVTAYAGDGHRARALAEGFRLHLAKPIEPQALLSAVAELAHRSPSGRPAPNTYS